MHFNYTSTFCLHTHAEDSVSKLELMEDQVLTKTSKERSLDDKDMSDWANFCGEVSDDDCGS